MLAHIVTCVSLYIYTHVDIDIDIDGYRHGCRYRYRCRCREVVDIDIDIDVVDIDPGTKIVSWWGWGRTRNQKSIPGDAGMLGLGTINRFRVGLRGVRSSAIHYQVRWRVRSAAARWIIQ